METALQQRTTVSRYKFTECLDFISQTGKGMFGNQFVIRESDHEVIFKLLVYFFRDEPQAKEIGIDLNKGILLIGPINCGKTSLMTLMRTFLLPGEQFPIKPCREIGYELHHEGFPIIHKYSTGSFLFNNDVPHPRTWCFDDLGAEGSLKYFGNDCNVMTEIILGRYDQFVSHQMLTHITTSLTPTEIEKQYGKQVRSRLKRSFNLISFENSPTDQ